MVKYKSADMYGGSLTRNITLSCCTQHILIHWTIQLWIMSVRHGQNYHSNSMCLTIGTNHVQPSNWQEMLYVRARLLVSVILWVWPVCWTMTSVRERFIVDNRRRLYSDVTRPFTDQLPVLTLHRHRSIILMSVTIAITITFDFTSYNYNYKQLQLCQLQLQLQNYQLQLLLFACKDRYRIRNTIYCITARRHWYIYCKKLNITVQSVVPMSISLVALNEHKLLSALMQQVHQLSGLAYIPTC